MILLNPIVIKSKIINPIKEFNGMFIKFNTVDWLLAGTQTQLVG